MKNCEISYVSIICNFFFLLMPEVGGGGARWRVDANGAGRPSTAAPPAGADDDSVDGPSAGADRPAAGSCTMMCLFTDSDRADLRRINIRRYINRISEEKKPDQRGLDFIQRDIFCQTQTWFILK